VKKINRIIVFVILIILVLVSISVIPRFHAKNTYFDDSIGVGIDPPDFDVGIIQPYPINGGDVIPTGEYEAALKVRFEVGDKPSQEDFRVLIESFEGLEWREVYSEIKGPYDLDPDACMD
jgi:hypothetical protein